MKLPRGFSLWLLSVWAASTAAAQTTIDLRTQAKSVDFSAASMTKPIKTGTALPSTCTTGEMFFKSDAAAGSNLYGCVSTNTWSQQAGGGSGGGSGPGAPNVSQSFTGVTAVTVNHALATTNVIVQCYDGTSKAIEANSVTVIDTGSVAVTFSSPQTGRCVVNGTGGSGGGGGGGGTGEANTASNVGTAGVGAFHQKFGIDLQFKNVNSGSNRVSVSNDAANREIDIDIVASNIDLATLGGSLSAAQVGAASKQGNGSKLQTFGAGTPAANDCAKFDASGNLVSAGAPCGTGGGGAGEANTASSAGVGGVGIFHQKSGADLQFKNVNAASPRVSVTNDAANREVDIDVVSSNLDLSLLGGSLSPSQIAATGRQGNGTKVQMSGAGTPAANDCAKFDANGNIISAGAACGAGGGGDTIEADFGIVITQTGVSTKKVSIDTAAVPSFVTSSATLDFGAIAQSACAELTVNTPGAATGDSVAAGWPQTLEAGLTGNMFVSAQNTVTVRLCKITAGSVDPANQTFRATIVRSF